MIKNALIALTLVLAVGCGGGSDDPAPADSNPGTTPPVNNPGTPGTPTGNTTGIWVGNTDFGSGVYVIDGQQILYGLSTDNVGSYKSLHGPITAAVARFDHRVSDEPEFGTGITIVGTPDENFAEIAYTFGASDDGAFLTNTSTFGTFNMQRDNTVLTLADAVGTYETRTAFCPSGCRLSAGITISGDGTITGFTNADSAQAVAEQVPLNGTVTEEGQFLRVQFTWNGLNRSGVIYRDFGTANVVMNTVGFESTNEGSRSFTGIFLPVQ